MPLGIGHMVGVPQLMALLNRGHYAVSEHLGNSISKGTVKPNSARITSVSASLSLVVPVFPAIGGLGCGGVSVEDEGNEPAEEAV